MGCHQSHATGHATQGQGDAALSGTRQASRNAVDQLYLNTMSAQPLGLFATAPKNARVATLETHHAFALAGVAQHQALDKGLGRGTAASPLADSNYSCSRAMLQHRWIDQIINHHHVCGP
ncbi:hypothetical protein D3C81_1492140 [compost metagenome]